MCRILNSSSDHQGSKELEEAEIMGISKNTNAQWTTVGVQPIDHKP